MSEFQHGDTATYVELADGFDELRRRVQQAAPEDAPEAIVKLAVELVGGADCASMTVLNDRGFRTAASSDERAEQADKVQYATSSGPCVDAIRDDAVYRIDDLREDDRWPEFGIRAADVLGLHSMVCYRLAVDGENVIAGLNLYSSEVDAFDDKAMGTGLLIAAHASLALSAVLNRERAANLEKALQSNRDIGVAMGVLMHRHKLSRQQAFDLLRVASQQSNRKLRDVALEVAETGTLPVGREGSNGGPRR